MYVPTNSRHMWANTMLFLSLTSGSDCMDTALPSATLRRFAGGSSSLCASGMANRESMVRMLLEASCAGGDGPFPGFRVSVSA